MPHPLDRPVWSALSGRQLDLSVGDAFARRFAPDIGPLAAARTGSAASLAALSALVPDDGALILLEAEDAAAVPDTGVSRRARGVQMVAGDLKAVSSATRMEPLSDADAPEMLALANLTEPGPFAALTHTLGQFWGVREGGRLVAMAGERMKPEGFAEVSGVCVHPDHRGRGYAAALSALVADQITARGETPFLHAYADNAGAIRLYESLGFAIRCGVTVAVLT
jgi:ribosomal protein S18 acetylase RimI-like enzyme